MNLQTRYQQLLAFLIKYKWLSLLILTLLFFLLLIIIASHQFNTPSYSPTVSKPTGEQTNISPSITQNDDVDGLSLSKKTPGLQKVENLPDGTIKYTIKSDVPSRPDITILRGKNEVFTRSVSTPNAIPSLSSYLNTFGQPSQIIKGSKFYGTDAQWYLYTENGMAFVTKNNQVLEVHIFYAMTAGDYIKKFGDDIIQ